jgi:hypothetical protein
MSAADKRGGVADLVSLEAHMELARKGARTPHQTAALAKRYADALTKFSRAESDLARASQRWNKSRLLVRRYELELDKLSKVDR